MSEQFAVIIVGGGHAGAEAAWASARLGVPTLLVTMEYAAIGRMSCNPAIGGIGKGQIVREIDALGGLMGLAADIGGIQFRTLNLRKGPAVQAPRAQCDRVRYADAMQSLISAAASLTIVEGIAREIEVDTPSGDDRPRIRAVRLTDGRRFTCRSAVLTTGTFLRSVMHTGEVKTYGGRLGEPSADALSASLQDLGFELERLKTGTPPRVSRDSIDYERIEEQPADDDPRPFSFMNKAITQRQISCWITYTNERSHELIRANLDRAPMYTGQIQSRGPRYCPSIEDKVVRFAEKDRHQVFLEPEGYDSDWVYCNGIPTSLPADIQVPLVHSIVGLEKAEIVQMGYAIEYDWIPPHQTRSTLEAKRIRGLFLAGQVNGTSGYEEAAGQGLVAGVNAARQVLDKDPLILRRDQGYIGVMIDDLVTKGTVEPYRMFTSRAEYRLLLRSDNADVRLTPIGREFGLVNDARWHRFGLKQQVAAAFESWAKRYRHDGRPLFEWFCRAELDWSDVIGRAGWRESLPTELSSCDDALLDEAVTAARIEAKYGGYVLRQEREVERFLKAESRMIPDDFDFLAIKQLRIEARERLAAISPRSIGQAKRISGINPVDIAVLMLYLRGPK